MDIDWPVRTREAVERLQWMVEHPLYHGGTIVPLPDLALLLSDYERLQGEKIAAQCGGCRGEGAHRRHCPHNPDYTLWRRLADDAETLGDRIGSNNPGLANTAYGIAGALMVMHEERLEQVRGEQDVVVAEAAHYEALPYEEGGAPDE